MFKASWAAPSNSSARCRPMRITSQTQALSSVCGRAVLTSLVWALLLAWTPMRAAELVSGPTIETLSTTKAVVRWTTDVAAGARVQYGTAPGKLDRRASGGVSRDHALTLTNLEPATRYVYTVGTSRYALATNSFQTPSASASPDATAPTRAERAQDTAATARPPRPAGQAAWTPPPAPPARTTWGSYATLEDHFDRHGSDFKAGSPEEYAAMAWQFLQRAKAQDLPMKQDEQGVLRVFDPKTGAFAAYNRDGTTKTYFKPRSRDYFTRQPGKIVKAKDLP